MGRQIIFSTRRATIRQWPGRRRGVGANHLERPEQCRKVLLEMTGYIQSKPRARALMRQLVIGDSYGLNARS